MVTLIRKGQEEDRIHCLDIIKNCLFKVNRKYYTPKFINYLVESYEKKFLKRPELYTIVIEREGKVLGTGSLSTQGQILDVFIDINYHGKGFGKSIMSRLEDIAVKNNFSSLFLYSSISATQFYEKLGYSRIEELDHGDGDIEIKMEKKMIK